MLIASSWAEILIAVELLAKLPGILAFVFHFRFALTPTTFLPLCWAGNCLQLLLLPLHVAAAQTLERTLIRSCHARQARARAPESCLPACRKVQHVRGRVWVAFEFEFKLKLKFFRCVLVCSVLFCSGAHTRLGQKSKSPRREGSACWVGVGYAFN